MEHFFGSPCTYNGGVCFEYYVCVCQNIKMKVVSNVIRMSENENSMAAKDLALVTLTAHFFEDIGFVV